MSNDLLGLGSKGDVGQLFLGNGSLNSSPILLDFLDLSFARRFPTKLMSLIDALRFLGVTDGDLLDTLR